MKKARFILVLCIGMLFQVSGVLAQEKTHEDFLKAFTRERYIKWPEESKRKESFTLGIVNDTALYNNLKDALGKRALFKKRRITVQHFTSFQQAKSVRSGIVYLNKSEGIAMDEAIAPFKGLAVLVVGENFPFNQSMINLVSMNGKISFEYNKELIEAQGLTVAEDLTKLSAKSEIQWNKMLAEAEAKLAKEQELLEQKNKQISSTNKSLNKAHRNISEKEKQLQEKNQLIDSAHEQLSLRQREIAIEKRESALKSEKIAEQKRFMMILVIAVVLGLVAIFFIYRSYSISRKANIKLIDLNKSLKQHKDEIFLQKTIVEEKRKEITDSINYALRIQRSLLPSIKNFNHLFPESFIVFKPKDIVSGDFYWFERLSPSKILFSVVDCTGHGVPGAFMSVIGINQLNKIVHENRVTSPESILKELDMAVRASLHQHNHEDDANDGMEMAICMLDTDTNVLYYSGAFNPLWIVTSRPDNPALHPYTNGNGEAKAGLPYLVELQPDKKSVASLYKPNYDFALHKVALNKGDCIYVFSDGYADQFGGRDAKKFKKSQFKELLISIHTKKMADQKNNILETFDQWKGSIEQLDDVCVMGIRL